MLKIKSIGVYCGTSNTCPEIYRQAASDLGCFLAKHDIELVYGGGRQGLMGVLAKSVLDNRGRVYGVIPRFLDKVEHGFEDIDDLIYVDTMHERKQKMFERAEAFLILPGGFGTMDEASEIITWKQVGLHRKLIIFMDIDGYWSIFLNHVSHMIEQNFIRSEDTNLFSVLKRIEDLDCFMLAPKSNQDDYVSKFA